MAKSNLIVQSATKRTRKDLDRLAALPLIQKVPISERLFSQFYNVYQGKIYISFSGGLGSTVLIDIARRLFPDIEIVFSDTGLEYPEIVKFAMTKKPTVVKPIYTFRQVIDRWGFAFPSKSTAMAISRYRNTKSEEQRKYRKWGRINAETGKKETAGIIPQKHHDLIDAPFKISDHCCQALKKDPLKKFAKKSGKHPVTGEQACESDNRRKMWLKNGCNAFDAKSPKSTPLAFWTEQDILEYIVTNKLDYCKDIYGEIIKEQIVKELEVDHDGFNPVFTDITDKMIFHYRTTKAQRTGCMWCMFGVEQETKSRKGHNRFTDMYYSHPEIWHHCIHMLGIGKLLTFKNIPYDPVKHIVLMSQYALKTVK